MFDSSTITFSEVVTIVRNVGILATILVAGWKARSLVQPVVDFLDDTKRLMKRGERHMDVMEESMSLLLDNHLTHIGNHVRAFAHNQIRASVAEQNEYETADAVMEAEGSPPLDSPDQQV